MSIDELEELLSNITDPKSASPVEAVLQSKSIRFLSSEIAIFKEALSRNILDLNNTIGITNKNVKELRDSIKDSTKDIIDSNKKLAGSQNIHSWIMVFLTLALVLVGYFQFRTVQTQTGFVEAQLNMGNPNIDFESVAWKDALSLKDKELYINVPLINKGERPAENFYYKMNMMINDAKGDQPVYSKNEKKFTTPFIMYPNLPFSIATVLEITNLDKINNLIRQKQMSVLVWLYFSYNDQITKRNFNKEACFELDGTSVGWEEEKSSNFNKCKELKNMSDAK